jgi:uncharacterized membrane protein YbhN (UPF0104 family)
MSRPWPRLLATLARLAVTGMLLWWVFRRVQPDRLWAQLHGVDWRWVVAGWAVSLLALWASSVKLRLVLREVGCDAPTPSLFCASAVTGLYSLALPGALSTGVKWFLLRRIAGDGAAVLAAMAYNQMQVLLSVVLLGTIALYPAAPPAALQSLWLLVAALLIAAMAAAAAAGTRMSRLVTSLIARLPRRLGDAAVRLRDRLRAYYGSTTRFHTLTLLFTLANSLLSGPVLFLFAALAVGETIPMPVLTFLWAVVLLLGRLPISIANLGVREATTVGLLAHYGVASPTALLLALVVFSAAAIIALMGALCQLVHR